MFTYSFAEIVERTHTHSFIDTDLSEIIGHLWDYGYPDVYIAGGAVRRTIEGKIDLSDTDIDFFFTDHDQYLTMRRFLEAHGRAVMTSETPDVVNYNVTLLMHNIPSKKDGTGVELFPTKIFKFQLIKNRYYSTAVDLLNSFDFTICQFVTGRNRTLTVGEYALWDLGRRKLAVNKITFPLSSMRRMIKYTNQGFTACNGAMQAILESVVNDPKLLSTRFQYID